jgi:hypothetical protein
MRMPEAAAMPSVAEAMGWRESEVTDLDGAKVGRVEGLFVDAGSGDPAWLILRLGKRRRTRLVAVPIRSCAGAPFGVWVALSGSVLRGAPIVDPARPLRREHELALCAHLGIGESVGRAGEVVSRPADAVTAAPPGG